MKNATKWKYLVIAISIVCVLFVLFYETSRVNQPSNAIQRIAVKRSADNPLITPASSSSIGNNINGPSVIRVPRWVSNPLGLYYMYFAHHRGKYIRMAYADNLSGPWTVYEPGVLHLENVPICRRHIASPDVHIVHQNRSIIMYFHGPVKHTDMQSTLSATSKDGLLFYPGTKILGKPYFRVFNWKGHLYAINSGGGLNRYDAESGEWDSREKSVLPYVTVDDLYGRRTDVKMRHSTVFVDKDLLYLFYSRKRDAPERILASTIRLTDDWNQWSASQPIEVMRPQESYEGIQYPIKPSKGGTATHVHQLRDPYLFHEDGKFYLFYSIAGEMGIALAEITLTVEKEIN